MWSLSGFTRVSKQFYSSVGQPSQPSHFFVTTPRNLDYSRLPSKLSIAESVKAFELNGNDHCTPLLCQLRGHPWRGLISPGQTPASCTDDWGDSIAQAPNKVPLAPLHQCTQSNSCFFGPTGLPEFLQLCSNYCSWLQFYRRGIGQ